jgi:hypothetical protein
MELVSEEQKVSMDWTCRSDGEDWECIQNVGCKTVWRVATWKTKKVTGT